MDPREALSAATAKISYAVQSAWSSFGNEISRRVPDPLRQRLEDAKVSCEADVRRIKSALASLGPHLDAVKGDSTPAYAVTSHAYYREDEGFRSQDEGTASHDASKNEGSSPLIGDFPKTQPRTPGFLKGDSPRTPTPETPPSASAVTGSIYVPLGTPQSSRSDSPQELPIDEGNSELMPEDVDDLPIVSPRTPERMSPQSVDQRIARLQPWGEETPRIVKVPQYQDEESSMREPSLASSASTAVAAAAAVAPSLAESDKKERPQAVLPLTPLKDSPSESKAAQPTEELVLDLEADDWTDDAGDGASSVPKSPAHAPSNSLPATPLHKFQANSSMSPKSVLPELGVESTASSTVTAPAQERQMDKAWHGPVTKEELGRATWTFLHTLAAQYPEAPSRKLQRDVKAFINLLPSVYPCRTCGQHFKEVLRSNPPQVGSRGEMEQYICRIHNVVNRSLSKPEFPCKRVSQRWGSVECDDACEL